MEGLTVKGVDLMGDTIMAAQDESGSIWAGVSYFCKALGMSNVQKDTQVDKIRTDKTLSRGYRKFPVGVFDPNNEVIGIRLDFVPLWLAKITITKRMENDHPELADKLLNYQLKAKDILAAAFLPSSTQAADLQQHITHDIPVGEVARLSTVMDRIMVRQNSKPNDIARAFEMLCQQFGIALPENFVNVPEYEQLTIESMGK